MVGPQASFLFVPLGLTQKAWPTSFPASRQHPTSQGVPTSCYDVAMPPGLCTCCPTPAATVAYTSLLSSLTPASALGAAQVAFIGGTLPCDPECRIFAQSAHVLTRVQLLFPSLLPPLARSNFFEHKDMTAGPCTSVPNLDQGFREHPLHQHTARNSSRLQDALHGPRTPWKALSRCFTRVMLTTALGGGTNYPPLQDTAGQAVPPFFLARNRPPADRPDLCPVVMF